MKRAATTTELAIRRGLSKKALRMIRKKIKNQTE